MLFYDAYTRDVHLLTQFSHVNKSDKRPIRHIFVSYAQFPYELTLLASFALSKAVVKKIWVSMNLIYREQPYRITYAIFIPVR